VRDRARVVIIGGGIGGCSLAFHLAGLGWTDVVLLEKGELTSGSTWHAAGLCTQFNSSRNNTLLQMYSLELYKSLERRTGQAVDFHEVGSIRLASTPERMDEYERARSRALGVGLEVEILSPGEIGERWPIIDTDGLLGGLWIASDGYVDPSSVANAMAAGARDKGITIERRTLVTSLRPNDDGWTVETDRGAIDCEFLVNAAGMWAPRIGRMAGAELPIAPLEHHMIVTGAVPALADLPAEIPVIRDPDLSFYVRQEADGMIVGPFEEHTKAWSIDEGVPWDFEGRLLEPDLERIQEVLVRAGDRIDAVARAGIQRIVNGPDGYTPDGRCLMGWTPGVRNLFQLCGFSIFGIVTGGGAGRFAAEWIVEGQPSIDMWELDVSRFGTWASERSFLEPRTLDVYGYEYGIAFPHEERPAGRPQTTDPLHDVLLGRGAVMGLKFGWERPLWFAPQGVAREDHSLTFRTPDWVQHVATECRAVRSRVGILDQTSFAKYEVGGPGARALLDRLCANRVSDEIGKIVVTQMLTPRGGIECDLTVTRLDEDRYYVVGAAATRAHDLRWIARNAPRDGSVTLDDVTRSRGVLTLAGPRSRDVLSTVTGNDVSNEAFPWMSARNIRIGGVDVYAMRISYLGELGWELHHPIENLVDLYGALIAAGEDHGIVDFGYRALDSMRMEKAYRLWGADISADFTPLEAGLDMFVKPDDRDFIGRDALARQRDDGLERSLACLTVGCDDAIPLGDEAIRPAGGGDVVGYVSAAERGHVVDEVIALAYLPVALAGPGTALEVDVLGRWCHATVVRAPLFDPENSRLRA
jgi:dimethylglycine dehydrogenase